MSINSLGSETIQNYFAKMSINQEISDRFNAINNKIYEGVLANKIEFSDVIFSLINNNNNWKTSFLETNYI